ncbi:hypothetical protein CHARACLAT_011898 [Characodon lateralis]|uniref:CHHC U11-48K-type domain-containing protein n=1 Tax=Characodon lateralis TaxID=208331 RepID=A0ABU7EVS4_9TELE|nr:hypothetical protein [Characodon lateralis]
MAAQRAFEEEVEVETFDNRANWDPEKLLQCPFDKSHKIRSSRLPYHLIKCRKNHEKLARQLETCPFNARHLILKNELPHHIKTCEDRTSADDGSTQEPRAWQVPINTWVNPNTTEDWDKEVEECQTPFVWGLSSQLNQPSASRLSNVGPKFRAPNSLPWSS